MLARIPSDTLTNMIYLIRGYSGGKCLKVENLHIINMVTSKNIVYSITNFIVHIRSVITKFSGQINTLLIK